MPISGPRLEIDSSAMPYVADAYLDHDLYSDYLAARGVTTDQIDNHYLVVKKHLSLGTCAVFEPASRFNSFTSSIAISASDCPRKLSAQGDILRHESEHFIRDSMGHPYGKIGRVGMYATAVVGATGFMAVESFQAGMHATVGAPSPINYAAASIAGLAGASLGALSGSFFARGLRSLSYEEWSAHRAQSRQRDALPDGILRLTFH